MTSRIATILFASVLPLTSQTFNSGSTGTDGDLIYTAPTDGSQLTVVFDPNDKKQFPNGVDPEHDNIFNFGKITIPASVHIIMRADRVGGPVYFLATGDVLIQGWLDLDGNPGAQGGFGAQTFAVPGPGGFYGGGGGDTANRPPTAGFGPQPGAAANPANASCTDYGGGGGYTGDAFLVPLIGGSGGGGRFASAPAIGPGGGAGGGAILIASSGTITIGYFISARGSKGVDQGNGAGGGAGGSIRLAANTINGNGYLFVTGGPSQCTSGSAPAAGAGGRIRLEAFNQNFSGTTDGDRSSATPFATFIPTGKSPAIHVLTVNGVKVNANPNGSFILPDVTINSAGAVPVTIEADNIPAKTIIHLQIFSENGPSQAVNLPALTGVGPTFQLTTNIQFPTGFSRGFVQASFTAP